MRHTSSSEDAQGASKVSAEVHLPSWMADLADDKQHQRMRFRAKVAGRLVAAIADAGINHAQLARKTGVTRAQISQQLSGDANLTLDTLHKLATAVGLDVSIDLRSKSQVADVYTPSQAAIQATLAALQLFLKQYKQQVYAAPEKASRTDRLEVVQLMRTHHRAEGVAGTVPGSASAGAANEAATRTAKLSLVYQAA